MAADVRQNEVTNDHFHLITLISVRFPQGPYDDVVPEFRAVYSNLSAMYGVPFYESGNRETKSVELRLDAMQPHGKAWCFM